jgi:hypothetical protein
MRATIRAATSFEIRERFKELPRFGEGCAYVIDEYEKLKREFERHRAAPRVAKRWPLRREA